MRAQRECVNRAGSNPLAAGEDGPGAAPDSTQRCQLAHSRTVFGCCPMPVFPRSRAKEFVAGCQP